MRKPGRRTFWFFLAAVSGAAAVCLLLVLFQPKEAAVPPADQSSVPPIHSPAPVREEEPEPPEIPVDFDALQEENPDIYAWLSLPEAGIGHPVLRREGEDDYYLRRDLEGKYAIAGSLYTQSGYNAADFSDPVTVIYGHAMEDGAMFGQLRAWCQQTRLGEDAVFTIYQPERRLTFRIFAAVPYDNSHVLYYHDFHNEMIYTRFFEDVFATRDFHAALDPEGAPEYGDKVVILSTCLAGDSSRRFLVMGVLVEDTDALS